MQIEGMNIQRWLYEAFDRELNIYIYVCICKCVYTYTHTHISVYEYTLEGRRMAKARMYILGVCMKLH